MNFPDSPSLGNDTLIKSNFHQQKRLIGWSFLKIHKIVFFFYISTFHNRELYWNAYDFISKLVVSPKFDDTHLLMWSLVMVEIFSAPILKFPSKNKHQFWKTQKKLLSWKLMSIPRAKPKHSPDPRGVLGAKILVITLFSGLLNLKFEHRIIPHQVQLSTWSTFFRTLYLLFLFLCIYLSFHPFHTSNKSKEKVWGTHFFFLHQTWLTYTKIPVAKTKTYSSSLQFTDTTWCQTRFPDVT